MIFERILAKSTTKINEAVVELQHTVDRLQNPPLEQYSQKLSLRMCVVPELTPAKTDENLLHLFNADLKLRLVRLSRGLGHR